MLSRTMAAALCGALAAGLLLGSGVEAATKKSTKKPIKASAPIPNAREVELFEAIEAGEIEARVVPKDPFSAKVFIENKTDEPLNLKFPKAVVAAPILAQFGGGMGMGGMGMGGMGGGMGGMGGGMGGMGGGQMMGGGMGGGMGGMGGGMGGMGGMGGGMGGMGMGGMGGGGGFFSVPPEKIVSVSLKTVCLQHGKDDPNSSMKYKLVPVELVTKNATLVELMAMIGSGKIDEQTAQAATWRMTDMNWDQLASKEGVVSGVRQPYFTGEELAGAQQLLAAAAQRAEQRKNAVDEQKDDEETKTKPVARSVRSRTSARATTGVKP